MKIVRTLAMKRELVRLILIIAVSCLPLTIYADEVIGFINGVVVNSLTNEPIRDELKIEVLSDKGETIVSTNSRIEGRRSVFSTGMYSNGKYKLLITHEDYDSTYLDFEFNKNKKWVLPLGVINVRKLTRAEKGVRLGRLDARRPCEPASRCGAPRRRPDICQWAVCRKSVTQRSGLFQGREQSHARKLARLHDKECTGL